MSAAGPGAGQRAAGRSATLPLSADSAVVDADRLAEKCREQLQRELKVELAALSTDLAQRLSRLESLPQQIVDVWIHRASTRL